MLDLGAPTTTLTSLLERIDDGQLDAPTPCERTNVAELVTHVLGLSIAFRDAAAKIDGPTTSAAPDTSHAELPPDWRAVGAERLAVLAQAWRDPAAWEGMTKAGGLSLPGEVTALVANNELVMHGWDLAMATGQPFEVAPENLEASWQFVSQTPDTPEAREGLFGPVVDVPADAPLLDRTLGGAGRDPRWTPSTPNPA